MAHRKQPDYVVSPHPPWSNIRREAVNMTGSPHNPNIAATYMYLSGKAKAIKRRGEWRIDERGLPANKKHFPYMFFTFWTFVLISSTELDEAELNRRVLDTRSSALSSTTITLEQARRCEIRIVILVGRIWRSEEDSIFKTAIQCRLIYLVIGTPINRSLATKLLAIPASSPFLRSCTFVANVISKNTQGFVLNVDEVRFKISSRYFTGL
jgi:hypothetical protein